MADELERRWNDALIRVRSLEQRVEQEEASLARIAPLDIEELAHLASDLEQVWNDPAADVRLKQRIARTLIEMVIVDVEEPTNEVVAVIHWKGGVHTERRYPRRRSDENIGYTSEDIVEAVRILSRVCTDPTIASFLNRNRPTRHTSRSNGVARS